MKFALTLLSAALLVTLMAACANVDVTKTAKGYYPPTKPDNIEILMTRPEKHYIELGTVSTTQWQPNETAKMHNALRSKTAALGADAVYLTASGMDPNNKLWSTGVAIRYVTAGDTK